MSVFAQETRGSVHPKTWVVLSLSTLLLSLSPLPLWGRLSLWILQLTVLITCGKFRRYLLLIGVGLGPVALMAFMVQTISFPGETVYANWTPLPFMTFAVTAEGMIYGLHVALQVVNFGSACSMISLLTTAAGLRTALADWKIPGRLSYLLVASLNAPAQLFRYVHIEQEANRARGLADDTWRARTVAGLKTATNLFTLILIEHEARGRTLGYRGIDLSGRRIFYRDFSDSSLQRILRWIMPLAAVLVVGLALWSSR